MSDITVITTMYVVFNMGIIYYGVLKLQLWYVIQEIYLFLLHTFHVRIPSTAREELLVFRRAPPLMADGGTLTRYGGYRGNKIPGADQNWHCCLAV